MQQIEKKDIINLSNLSTQFGIYAGLGMALVLFVFQLSGHDYQPLLKYSNYLMLALMIIIALNIYNKNSRGDIFVKGLKVGFKTSFVAAITLVVINLIIYLVDPAFTFSKFSIEPSNMLQTATVSGALFFETLVFGSLIAFATLQYLKGDRAEKTKP